MKHSIIAFLFAIMAAVVFAPAAQAQAPERGKPSAELQNFVRDSYIFKLADSVSRGRTPARAAALVRQAGGRLGFTYSTVFRGFSARMTSVAADNLFRNNDDVIGYTRDGIVTIAQASPTKGKPKTPGGGGGNVTAPAQVTPWGITRVGCAPVVPTICAPAGDKKAWIIDTGIDLDHPDLNVAETGHISFVNSGKDPSNPDDQNGHGTHVAGTIAAIDNGFGVVGVAAGAPVVSVRVLDRRGSGSYSGVIAGVDYVASVASVGDVVNMSLGGPPYTLLDAAVKAAAAKGIHFAIAAGNSGTDANNHTPARANGDNIYTVSAIDSSDNFASWSNWGNPPVDFAAPGVSILSTWKGGGTKTISGTSMAAPHVAGLLLIGNVGSSGTASGDPDGNPDPIAHR